MFEKSHKLMFGGFKHFKGYQFEYVFNLHWELRTTDLTSGVQELNYFLVNISNGYSLACWRNDVFL